MLKPRVPALPSILTDHFPGAPAMDFFSTTTGRNFIESTIPNLVLQLQRIANSLERLLDRIEQGPGVPAEETASDAAEKAP